MGAPKGGTHTPWNVHQVGRSVEGDPKSEKLANGKGKGKNGGSNDASSGPARNNLLSLPDTGSHRGSKSRRSSFSNTVEGDPKSGKLANEKGKGKNGGSNDAPSGPARNNLLSLPDTYSHRGNKSRRSSFSNTPTSRPHTSPETKKENLASGNKSRDPSASNTPTSSPSNSPEPNKENLSRDINRVVTDGPTNTENQKHSPKKSTDASPTPLPSRNLLQRVFSPAPKPTPNKTAEPSSPENASGLADMYKDKQDDAKSAALQSSNPPTPPASPETRNLAVQPDLKNGPASSNSLAETTSGLAELKDKQDDVKPAALLSSDPPTTPASPETHNQIVPAALEDRPAPSMLENPSASAEIEGEQGLVQSTTPPEPTTTISSTPDPSPDLTPPQNPKSTLEYALDIQSTLNQIIRPTNVKNVSISVEILTSLDITAINLLIATTPPEPTTTISSTPDPPPDLTQNPKSTLEYALDIQSTLNQISRRTNVKNVSISAEILTSLDITAINLLCICQV